MKGPYWHRNEVNRVRYRASLLRKQFSTIQFWRLTTEEVQDRLIKKMKFLVNRLKDLRENDS